MAVVIETTVGDLTVDLFLQERPKACLNFLKLCKLKYYNYNLFHTIEHGFIAQTGDPTGEGSNGESVWGVVEGPHKRYFEAESLPKIKHFEPGLLSMVSTGKNMVGSQFFFTLGSDLTSLDGFHCVIGEVTEGNGVLMKLNEAIVDENFRPYQDIRITHTVVLEDPFDDPRGFQIPSRSPSPTPERMKNGRIGADEELDDTKGKSVQEIQELFQDREAKARATILEIVGDLPDADIAPPENVLFVCKLNPVTTDDDLEIIFSRFGKVKSCEVIRDKTTGDSLQYAFVEFEDKKACESAFFKMDNVLIDDRRIHVDFSQSVAKVKWRGKGRGVVHEDQQSGDKIDFNNLRGSNRHNANSRNRRRSRSKDRSPIANKRSRESYNTNRNKSNYYSRERKPSHSPSKHRIREQRDHHSRDNSKHYSNYDATKSSRYRDLEKTRHHLPLSPERVKSKYSEKPQKEHKKKKKHRRSSSSTTSSSSHTSHKKKKKEKKKHKKKKRHSSSSSD